jgi:hypothetical protein
VCVSAGRVQHYFPSKDALPAEAFATGNNLGTQRVLLSIQDGSDDPGGMVLAALIPRTDEDRRLFRVAQAFEVYALLALATGLGGFTVTAGLDPVEASDILSRHLGRQPP